MNNLIEWIFLVTTISGLLIYIYLIWNRNYWKKRNVKGPKPRLLIGNTPGMFTYSQHMAYDIDKIYRQYKGRERYVGLYFGRQPRLLILDPKLIHDVLLTNFKNFNKNDLFVQIDTNLDSFIKQNPFLLTGKEWKEKRSEISPALTISRIKASYPIMLEVCKKMTRFLEEQVKIPSKDGIHVNDLAERYTIEVVANCIFGLEAGGFSQGECILRSEGKKIFGGNETFDMFSLIIYSSFPIIRKILRKPVISKQTEEFFKNLTRDAIKHREQSKDDRVDFLNYLLQLRDKKNLSDFEMAGNAITFFIDGFETSSVLISHVIYMLAKHRNVYEKLRDEIKSIVAKNKKITFEELIEIPYLDCVINETLRLFPPAPFISKVCTEPYEFVDPEGKSFVMEKGGFVVIPIYSVQNDEQYYRDAEQFIPERFSIENGGAKKYKDMEVFLPFADGPRQCLGMRFALTQTKAAIVELVSNWEMSVNPKTRKEFLADPKNIIFTMEGGFWIDFKRIPNEEQKIE